MTLDFAQAQQKEKELRRALRQARRRGRTQRRLRRAAHDELLRSQARPAPAPAPLFDHIPPAPQPTPNATIEDRFIAFHRANPHVLAAMRRTALSAKRRGYKKWSIWGVLQVLRWEQHTPTATEDPWRINNSFTPIYARVLMHIEPALAGFFETRQTDIDIPYILNQLQLNSTENQP